MTDARIPYARYPGLSPLFLEFLRGGSEFFPDPPTAAAVEARARKILGSKSRVPPSAFRVRVEAARSAAQAMADGRAVASVAGHQVGLFTGPLYTVTKAFDTQRVAREIAARGVPAAPVFWALTDDHDLEEIARTARPGAEGPETFVLEGADRGNRRPVGALPVPEKAQEILAGFRESAKAPDAAEVLDPFVRRYAPGATYADAFIETLLDLTAPEPLLVLDPSHEGLRAAMTEFFALAVERRGQIEETLAQAAARLESSRRPVPVPHRPGVFPFFLIENGERRRVGDPVEALAKVRAGAAWPSTDVLTRPVLKSFLMPTAAAILGPAEIAYHAQSIPLFPIFGLEPPVLLPRSHLVLVGPAERRAAEALGVAPTDLLAPPDAPATPTAEADAVVKIGHTLDGELSALAARLQALDPSLSSALETTRQKAAFPLAQLAERIRKAAERKDTTTTTRRHRLATMLTPSGTTAERLYPPLVPMLAFGRDALARIRQAADGSTEGAAVVNLGEPVQGGNDAR
jgi:uncharacterized protein YllA (UPF0747 family)